LQLHATCSCLQLSLGIFTTIRSNFNYFGHSYNYDAITTNFILSVGWLLGLFLSMNILICPISRNNHQISHILKVFYCDIMVYSYVRIKIIFTIYYIYHKYIFVCILNMSMYVYCSYNDLKINIWIQKFIIQIWKLIFQLWNVYIFEFKKYLRQFDLFLCILIFCLIKNNYLSLKILIPILKYLFESKNQYLNLKF
jgi:hypothetical protein